MTITTIFSFFLSPLGRWVGGGVIVAAFIGGIYIKGYVDGKQNVQAKWDAAIQAAIERGENARDEAERTVPAKPEPGGLRHDRFNRDGGTM